VDQDWIGLMIFKNFSDQDWIGFNFIGSGLDSDWQISQSAHLCNLCNHPFISHIKHAEFWVRALDGLRKDLETVPLPRGLWWA